MGGGTLIFVVKKALPDARGKHGAKPLTHPIVIATATAAAPTAAQSWLQSTTSAWTAAGGAAASASGRTRAAKRRSHSTSPWLVWWSSSDLRSLFTPGETSFEARGLPGGGRECRLDYLVN